MKKFLFALAALSFFSHSAFADSCQPLVVNGTENLISFSGTGITLNSTQILAGTLPSSDAFSGIHGSMSIGSDGKAGSIQFSPKSSAYGQIQFSATANGTDSTLSGNIQLTDVAVQAIVSIAGANAMVCGISLDVVQSLQDPSLNSASTGSLPTSGIGYINQAMVYITLSNGQVLGPLSF